MGYGVQPTGGYSISVNELYLTDNSIVVNTELKGPEKGENAGAEQSFPYIVIRTEYLEILWYSSSITGPGGGKSLKRGMKQGANCKKLFLI